MRRCLIWIGCWSNKVECIFSIFGGKGGRRCGIASLFAEDGGVNFLAVGKQGGQHKGLEDGALDFELFVGYGFGQAEVSAQDLV